jgi:hypothetical protein
MGYAEQLPKSDVRTLMLVSDVRYDSGFFLVFSAFSPEVTKRPCWLQDLDPVDGQPLKGASGKAGKGLL